MGAALAVARLQQIDSRRDRLQAELERIAADLADDAKLRQAAGDVESAEKGYAEAERGRREAELATRALREQLQQAEASLYGGSIKNPKELQDLQADVVSLKKRQASLEESEFHWMEQAEVAEGGLQSTKARLAEAVKQVEATSGHLIARRAEIQAALDSLSAEREATARDVPAAHLGIYDRLRRVKQNVAVASVQDGACSACGTGLTPALQQLTRHAAELQFCPSCGRILYGD